VATILIIDDTPTNLGVMVGHLEAQGYRVLIAQDGEEGLQRAELTSPDVILLDVMMPGASGFDICRRLKSRSSTREIPVIFMTSLTETRDKVAGFAAGAVDYVTKPLQADEVLARIDTHLKLRAAQVQLEEQNTLLAMYREDLEDQVAERTAALHDSNRRLRAEVAERQRAEQQVRQLNEELEQRVSERTAQLSAANRELQAFAYSVSHDLRAPLRVVAGYASRLMELRGNRVEEQERRCLERIVDNTERMSALIESLLTYARAGHPAVRAEPVALEPLLRQLTDTFAARIAATGARIDIESPLAVPSGDATLLGQILTNLLDNALTYRRSQVAAHIRVSATLQGSMVVLRVADNGIGVAPEYQTRIFEVFERLHGPDEYPGNGIGLAIVAKAARLMGGDVAVQSALGEGSTFSVRLPAAPVGS
jgi:two-component system sensor histidine kinase/response regulator